MTPLRSPGNNRGEVGIEGLSDSNTAGARSDGRPERAVVGEYVELIHHFVKQVVDEDQEEERAEHAALRNSGFCGEEGGVGTADDYALLAVGEVALEPGEDGPTC